jgi:hypothetical protein
MGWFTHRRIRRTAVLAAVALAAGIGAALALPGSSRPQWTIDRSFFHAPGNNGGVELTDLACPSSSVCVAVGLGGGLTNGVAYRTSNAGRTWMPSFFSNVTLNSVSCPTARFCAAAGFSPTSATPSGGAIWITEDSGVHWVRSRLPAGAPPAVGSVYCSRSGPCLAEVQWSDLVSGILRSIDRGRQWRLVEKLPRGEQLGNVTCATDLLCFAGGSYDFQHALILRSTDGGGAWRAELPTSPPAAYIQDITCPSSSSCVGVGWWSPETANISNLAIGNIGSIWITHNSGQDWNLVQLPIQVGALSSVSCVSTQVCEALGQNNRATGVVLKTDTSGWSWFIHAQVGTVGGFGAIACVDQPRCWLAAAGNANPDGGGGVLWIR